MPAGTSPRQPGENSESSDEDDLVGLGECEQRRRGAEHRDRDRVPAPEAVGDQATDRGGDDVPGAVEADDESGLCDRVALLAQVEDEEDRDEAAEAVDERAGAKDPDGAGQCADPCAQCPPLLRHRPNEPLGARLALDGRPPPVRSSSADCRRCASLFWPPRSSARSPSCSDSSSPVRTTSRHSAEAFRRRA